MKTNRETAMALLITLARLEIIKKHTSDFPWFLVWWKDVKRYSDAHGKTDETEQM